MKRGNERQITKDDAHQEEEGMDAGVGEFAKADSIKLAQRRIRKVKKAPRPDTNSDAPNPFVGVTLSAAAPVKQPSPEVPADNEQTKLDSAVQPVADSADASTPVVEERKPTPAPATGFASFASATSAFKQLSQDSVGTADNTGGATPCSQDSVYTPPTTRTVTPCPSAPLRKSSTRAFGSPSSAMKSGMNSGIAEFGGTSAFKHLTEGASAFTASQGNMPGFGSPAFFGNGTNGSGPKKTAQAWQMDKSPPLDQGKQEGQKSENSMPGHSNAEMENITGEESEETVFSHEAALFALENGAWKNRGKADLRVNASKDGRTARLLMRRKGTLTVFFNARIYNSMKVSRMGADSCTFTCVNGAEETAGDKEEQAPIMKVYAIRFPVKGERANMLLSEFLKVMEQFQTKD